MPSTLSITGKAAELRWGYRSAGQLGAWSVAGEPGAWIFTALIQSVDDFAVSQRPLVVVTPNGWRWPVTTLQIVDGTLTASIRSQESEPHAAMSDRHS